MIDHPVFIAGAGRSGTTLMADMLGLHPRISPIYETDFVTVLIELLIKGIPGVKPEQVPATIISYLDDWTQPLPVRPHNKGGHERYHHGPHYLLFDRPFVMERAHELAQAVAGGAALEGLRAFLNALFEKHCALDHKVRWINKTPKYVEYLPWLLQLFPEMRIVHCVRDGRDVACSVMQRSWGPKTYSAAAAWWARKTTGAVAFEKEYPDRCLVVRYEDLLRTPDETLGRIFTWLGEEGDPANILSEYRADGVRLDPSRIGQWQQTFSPEDAREFEKIAGDSLIRFGYSSVSLRDEVHTFILSRIGGSWREGDLTEETLIGANGLGLDSIATLELLLDCEKHWSIPFPAELLERPPFTVGTLIQHVRQRSGR